MFIEHLLCARYSSCTVCINSFGSRCNSVRQALLLSSWYRVDTGSERLSDLAKATQLVNGRKDSPHPRDTSNHHLIVEERATVVTVSIEQKVSVLPEGVQEATPGTGGNLALSINPCYIDIPCQLEEEQLEGKNHGSQLFDIYYI